MAFSSGPTLLEASSSSTDATSYTSGTLTASGTADPFLACLCWTKASGTPNNPTALTGNSLTWTQITNATLNFHTAGTPRAKMQWWQGIGTGTTGTLLMDWGANTQTGLIWTITQWNGAHATTPCVTTNVVGTNADAATALTITMGSLASVNNAILFGFGVDNTSTITLEGGWTGIASTSMATPATRCRPGWAVGGADLTVGGTFTSGDLGGLGIEVQPAATAASSIVSLSRGLARGLNRSMRGNRQ